MGDRASTAYVLGPGEGRSIDLGAFRMSVKATGEQTNGLVPIHRCRRWTTSMTPL